MNEKELDGNASQNKEEQPGVNPKNKAGKPKEPPAERMRRLIASSEEDTIPPIQPGKKLTPEEKMNSTMGWFVPEEENSADKQPPEEVDSTAGWHGEGDTGESGALSSAGPSEQTGGWFDVPDEKKNTPPRLLNNLPERFIPVQMLDRARRDLPSHRALAGLSMFLHPKGVLPPFQIAYHVLIRMRPVLRRRRIMTEPDFLKHDPHRPALILLHHPPLLPQ